jgi:hypothetical protein
MERVFKFGYNSASGSQGDLRERPDPKAASILAWMPSFNFDSEKFGMLDMKHWMEPWKRNSVTSKVNGKQDMTCGEK